MKSLLTALAAIILAFSFAAPADAARAKSADLQKREAACKAEAAKKFKAAHRFLARREHARLCMGGKKKRTRAG
jgi:hypothetical protein